MTGPGPRHWVCERVGLGHRPTPVEEHPRLSQALGVRLLVKREDLAGLCLGGNKVRKLEALDQCAALDCEPEHVVVPAGTGTTAAGLAFGIAGRGLRVPVWAISVDRPPHQLELAAGETVAAAVHPHGSVPELAARAAELVRWEDAEIGPGYTRATPEAREAAAQLASSGLLSDLTYTAKGFAGLRRLVAEGEIAAGATVLWIHTGTDPGMFARPAGKLLGDAGSQG